MSYAVFKQSFAPTGVEYCAQANVTAENDLNLVVAKTSLLQIYTLRSTNNNAPAYTLDLLYERNFFGNIESVCPVKLPGAKRDSLVLSFRDAKVTVMEWDTHAHDLREASLHYFERPNLQDGHVRYRSRPVVRMDPKQRCAAMLLYDRRLAVLPFRLESSILDDDEPSPSSRTSRDDLESYVINLADLGIRNVKDYIFLAGYYEPTVLILHEPLQTWVGRLPLRKETCVLTALQLNIAQRVQPVIWTVDRLPHNSFQLVSVPEPLGGAIVLGVNALMYFNQSVRYSLALNEYAAQEPGTFTFEPLKEGRPLMSLDAAVCTFLSLECMLLSIKSGELYICQLISDGRSLRSIEICKVSDELLFLGSRLGDSLLIRFVQKSDKAKQLDLNDEPMEDIELTRPEKRVKVDEDELDDMDIFDDEEMSGKPKGPVQYSFSVCDSLINIGPVTDSVVGESQDPPSISHEATMSKNIEMVTCSGHGKNGTLCIMQRTIRPELITAFGLPGCTGMWTVFDGSGVYPIYGDDTKEEGETTPPAGYSDYHAYLILSKDNSTMVLMTGEALQEITDRVDFYVKGPTLVASNVCGRDRVVQVYPRGVRLLAGAKRVQEYSPKRTIVSATVLDPYIFLVLDGGSLHLLQANPDILVPIEVPPLPGSGNVSSVFLLSDASFFDSVRHTYCLMVIDAGMYVYRIPDFHLVFHAPQLSFAPSLLYHHPAAAVASTPASIPSSTTSTSSSLSDDVPSTSTTTDPVVVEVAIHYIGNTKLSTSLPTLFAVLDNGDVLVYRGFHHRPSSSSLSHARFAKMDHGIITRNPAADSGSEFKMDTRRSRIHQFENIADRCGVFIAGYRPVWAFCERSYPRIHPMDLDGSVPCFTGFHNINCLHGFIYINARGDLKICQLTSDLNYEAAWPIRKVPLRATPHRVAYHPEAKLYVAAVYDTLLVEPTIPADPTNPNPPPPPPPSKGPHLPVVDDRFELRLLTPPSFEMLDRFVFEPNEQVLTLRLAMLRTENGGTVPYVVVGTGFLMGEDTACKGRVLIFDVQRHKDIVLDDQPQEDTKERGELRLAFAKDEKSPVSAVAQLDGYDARRKQLSTNAN